MSMLVRLIDLDKAKSAFWPSLHWESQCYPYIRTWCLKSFACSIPGSSSNKHQQTSFPSKNVPFIYHKDEISAVIHRDLARWTNTLHRPDLVQLAGWLPNCAMSSYVEQDSSCVERASWLLPMPFWLEANYIFLRTSHVFSLSSSSGLPTLFHYHHLFTSTAANHDSTSTAARWN